MHEEHEQNSYVQDCTRFLLALPAGKRIKKNFTWVMMPIHEARCTSGLLRSVTGRTSTSTQKFLFYEIKFILGNHPRNLLWIVPSRDKMKTRSSFMVRLALIKACLSVPFIFKSIGTKGRQPKIMLATWPLLRPSFSKPLHALQDRFPLIAFAISDKKSRLCLLAIIAIRPFEI